MLNFGSFSGKGIGVQVSAGTFDFRTGTQTDSEHFKVIAVNGTFRINQRMRSEPIIDPESFAPSQVVIDHASKGSERVVVAAVSPVERLLQQESRMPQPGT